VIVGKKEEYKRVHDESVPTARRALRMSVTIYIGKKKKKKRGGGGRENAKGKKEKEKKKKRKKYMTSRSQQDVELWGSE